MEIRTSDEIKSEERENFLCGGSFEDKLIPREEKLGFNFQFGNNITSLWPVESFLKLLGGARPVFLFIKGAPLKRVLSLSSPTLPVRGHVQVLNGFTSEDVVSFLISDFALINARVFVGELFPTELAILPSTDASSQWHGRTDGP